jgi:hypothetical protein
MTAVDDPPRWVSVVDEVASDGDGLLMEAKLRLAVFAKGAAATDDGSKESSTKMDRMRLNRVL